jgi:hypothetical protein
MAVFSCPALSYACRCQSVSFTLSRPFRIAELSGIVGPNESREHLENIIAGQVQV